MNTWFLGPAVATVLTVYGIETVSYFTSNNSQYCKVATVLTVYGIETTAYHSVPSNYARCNSAYRLRY